MLDGELVCASKRKELLLSGGEKLFNQAIDTALRLAPELKPDWIYRGEYLQKPKHNALAYRRTPRQHIMLYDICRGLEDYLGPEEKAEEAERLGLECVPVLQRGAVLTAELFAQLLERESVLGDAKIEGVVVKNYGQFGPDKKVLMAKYVSEYFKEKHAATWKLGNPGPGDIVQQLIQVYRVPRRWEKAIEHLRDAGELEDEPRDIAKLVPEIKADIEKECKEEIKDALYQWAAPKLMRGVIAGFPEFYKARLMNQQFNEEVLGENSDAG